MKRPKVIISFLDYQKITIYDYILSLYFCPSICSLFVLFLKLINYYYKISLPLIIIAMETNNKKQRWIVLPGCAGRHRQNFSHFNNFGNPKYDHKMMLHWQSHHQLRALRWRTILLSGDF